MSDKELELMAKLAKATNMVTKNLDLVITRLLKLEAEVERLQEKK